MCFSLLLLAVLFSLLSPADISDQTNKPSQSNHTWSAASFRNDSITIPSSQLHTGPYWIGVTAFLNCSFTIVVTYDEAVQLQDGRPQNDAVLKEQSRYYTLLVEPTSNEVTVSLTPRSGYAKLFIANGIEPEWDKPETYHWSSSNAYSAQLIAIPSNDTHACGPSTVDSDLHVCVYHILVRGISDCQFSLTGMGGSGGTDLQEGHPLQATVSQGKYQHFKFNVDSPTRDVAITVTPISGDPDVCT